MFHPKFVNDHEPFTWLIPTVLTSVGRYVMSFPCRVLPYTEGELVRFRTQWLLSTVYDFSPPLLPAKGSVAEYLERGR